MSILIAHDVAFVENARGQNRWLAGWSRATDRKTAGTFSLFHQDRREPALEQMPHPVMPAIVRLSVSTIELAHAEREVGCGVSIGR